MDITRSIFLATTIILFALGIWPLALITAIVTLTLSEVVNVQKKKQFEKLEAKVEALEQKLEAEQVVKRAMENAERNKEVRK